VIYHAIRTTGLCCTLILIIHSALCPFGRRFPTTSYGNTTVASMELTGEAQHIAPEVRELLR
jgi:hypothetical protein